MLVSAALIYDAVSLGIGQPQASPERLRLSFKLVTIEKAIGTVSLALAQISVAVTLLRVAADVHHKLMIWVVVGSVALSKFFACIFVFASCTPIRRRWDSSVAGTCWDGGILVGFWIATSGKGWFLTCPSASQSRYLTDI